MFPVRRVDRSQAESVEPLGSKRKFWFRENNSRFLFKAEERGTGEDWAEVIACHLCRLLDLPHIEYELAEEFVAGQYVAPGVVCANMVPLDAQLVLGNQLLLAVDPQYPSQKRFKVRQHTVDAVANIMHLFAPPTTDWLVGLPKEVVSALEVFVGYIMLDAWIANQDRHHENWGGLFIATRLHLAPTFDHAAGLARNLSDRERDERLVTRDRQRTVDAYALRGKSAFYLDERDERPLDLVAAFNAFADYAPKAQIAWLDRLQAVEADEIRKILDEVPPGRMSDTAKQFTIELLAINRRRLLEQRITR